MLRAGTLVVFGAALIAASAQAFEIEPRVAAEVAAQGGADVLLVTGDQTLPAIDTNLDYRSRRSALVAALMLRAEHDQRNVRAALDARGIAHRDFWIVNAIHARVTQADVDELGAQHPTLRIEPNPNIARFIPQTALQAKALQSIPPGIEWGVAKINAPSVWNAGFTGQGVVIGGEDTGYQWDHPALQPHYRGWNGSTATHDFNWHDAIHNAGSSNPCGSDSLVPCDDDQHGTHTAGTFVGDNGANASPRYQTGVAPGAQWIGCRNMDQGVGTPARYIECMQFMMAPTDLTGANADPDLAADVISNSWSCPTREGCSANTLQAAVDAVVAAGIFYAVAAQNYGPTCGSVREPPAIYDSSFVVGATDQNDALAPYSSWGPVAISSKIRPDLVAPGDYICSSIPTNLYTCGSRGTSMATPHVAGAAALLMSAFPEMKGRPDTVAAILRGNTVTSGVTEASQTQCGGITGTMWPNYMLGYGRLDVYKAYRDVIAFHDFDG